MKKLLSSLFVLLLVLSMLVYVNAEIPANTNFGSAIVIGGWLRMRSGPGNNYQTIASYEAGTVVSISATIGDWCKVSAPDGTIGYMSRYYLNAYDGTPNNNFSNAGGYNAYVYSDNKGPVMLRTGPSFSYGVIAAYPYGTPLYVVTHGSQWDYIQIDNQYGYMKNQYIRTSASSPSTNPSQYYLAYVYSRNGKGVRLRSGASLNSPILGVYSVGTEVTVTQHDFSKGWDAVNIGSRSGYMMNEFLTTTYSGYYQNITDVTLNKESANINDIISVTSITPHNASANYRWSLNNTLLSENSTVAIPHYAAGQNIKLVVTGIGNYSGNITKYIYVIPNTSIPFITPLPIITQAPVSNLIIKLDYPSYSLNDVIIPTLNGACSNVTYDWYREGTHISSGFTYQVVKEDIAIGTLTVIANITDYNGNSYVSSANILVN